MSFLLFTLPLEYIVAVILVLVAYPSASTSDAYQINFLGSWNYSILAVMALCMSVPYFMSTLVSLCRKRRNQLFDNLRQDDVKEK